MNERLVKIPNASQELRIGYSFNYLIRVIADTQAVDGKVLWDFSDVNFMHPFFLAPLAIFKNTAGKDIECINIPLRVQSYLNSICFDRILHFNDEKKEDVEDVMAKYLDKTFIPLCSFAMTDSNKDSFGSLLQRVIARQVEMRQAGNHR